uniref:Secreted protein n=1 Tax=Octopus bimaculoides TaxID=37653 RepID=A0A0L8GI86_OCTBM
MFLSSQTPLICLPLLSFTSLLHSLPPNPYSTTAQGFHDSWSTTLLFKQPAVQITLAVELGIPGQLDRVTILWCHF